MIGYYITQYDKYEYIALGLSGKPISFRLADLDGNTGEWNKQLLQNCAYIYVYIYIQHAPMCVFATQIHVLNTWNKYSTHNV